MSSAREGADAGEPLESGQRLGRRHRTQVARHSSPRRARQGRSRAATPASAHQGRRPTKGPLPPALTATGNATRSLPSWRTTVPKRWPISALTLAACAIWIRWLANRPDRRLPGRPEAARPEAGALALEPANDRVAPADLREAGPVVVQRQDARHLPPHRLPPGRRSSPRHGPARPVRAAGRRPLLAGRSRRRRRPAGARRLQPREPRRAGNPSRNRIDFRQPEWPLGLDPEPQRVH